VKNSKTCPKCGGKKICRPKYSFATGNPGLDSISVGLFGAVFIHRYICLDCGYVELWIDEEKDILRIEEKYACEKKGTDRPKNNEEFETENF
jgi:predicted RNA-binding Zn-ribbon protein involved in translation (DUF1610 family)